MVEISIVLPAYNEVDRIGPTLRSFHSYMEKRGGSFEIIVVDDGSTDETVSFVEKMQGELPHLTLVTTEKNRGKGHAVRVGMLKASGKIRLFSDADGSTPIEDLEKVLKPIVEDGFDIAIGSRYLKDSEIVKAQPFVRKMYSKFANSLIRKFLIPGILDLHCGFKAFTAESARSLFSQCEIDGWTFDIEVLGIARKLNYKMIEVPVKWSNDDRSKGSITHLPKEYYSFFVIKRKLKRFK